MTGEITLSGLVLPVGGIREKALAARRHGITTFVLPARNEPDLAELPPEVRKNMHFVPVDTLEEVLEVALPPVTDRLLHFRPRTRPRVAGHRGHQHRVPAASGRPDRRPDVGAARGSSTTSRAGRSSCRRWRSTPASCRSTASGSTRTKRRCGPRASMPPSRRASRRRRHVLADSTRRSWSGMCRRSPLPPPHARSVTVDGPRELHVGLDLRRAIPGSSAWRPVSSASSAARTRARRARCGFRCTAGFEPMAGVTEDIPLIARRAKHRRETVRRALAIDDDAIVVLASFGGYGLRLPYREIARVSRFTLVVTDHETGPEDDRHERAARSLRDQGAGGARPALPGSRCGCRRRGQQARLRHRLRVHRERGGAPLHGARPVRRA